MKLVKLLSLTALMCGFANLSNAQEASNTDSMAMSYGVKGGVNFTNVNGDDIDGPDSRTSFHVGLMGELPLADIFSLQAEVLYSGQGFEYDFEGPGGDKVEYQLDYINVPILAKLYVVKGLSFEVGPQFGFLVSEEIDYEPTADDGDIDLNQVDTFDFSVAGGVTFLTDLGFFASGRYNLGVTDIIEDVNGKNSVFQISVGYKF